VASANLSSRCSAFSSKTAGLVAQRQFSVAATRNVLTVEAAKESVCIVNTNSGGHAVLGFYLAKELAEKGHAVTIMVPGDEKDKKMNKTPFNRFDELREAGVTTVWGDPNEMAKATKDGKYDVVVENNGKKLEEVKPVADWAKAIGASQFLYVSSAGMYESTALPPITENDPVDKTAGHAKVEEYCAKLEGIHFSAFRPQYMVGSGNNKDCEEWFFDRMVRSMPIYIPGSGMQIVNVAHASDNAHMIALAVGNEKAHGQIFNCVRNKGVTLNQFVQICSDVSGIDVKVEKYDPAALGISAKKAFPFRTEYHFFCVPKNAEKLLGWAPKNDLSTDLVERFTEYMKSPRFTDDKLEFEYDQLIGDSIRIDMELFLKELNEIHDMEYMI